MGPSRSACPVESFDQQEDLLLAPGLDVAAGQQVLERDPAQQAAHLEGKGADEHHERPEDEGIDHDAIEL